MTAVGSPQRQPAGQQRTRNSGIESGRIRPRNGEAAMAKGDLSPEVRKDITFVLCLVIAAALAIYGALPTILP